MHLIIRQSNFINFIANFINNTRYTSTKTQARYQQTYLFMIYERFRRYSHLPNEVVNKGINYYDTKLSIYLKI